MKGFTTISIKPEVSKELGKLQKELKVSKHKVIQVLILIRQEFIKTRGRIEYRQIINKDTIKADDFKSTLKNVKDNMKLLLINQRYLNKSLSVKTDQTNPKE